MTSLILLQISQDFGKAKELFTASLEQSKAIGLEEGIEHAEDGLRSLGSDANQNTALSPRQADS